MKNCYLIKIPFATKGIINQRENSLRIKGYANYVYDFNNNNVIHQYLVLENATFRLTDKNMLKTSGYYNKSKMRIFRDEFLDPITNHNPNELVVTLLRELTKEQILKINKYFSDPSKSLTTIGEQFGYLSGSNINGGIKYPEKSPLVCLESGYVGCNFLNPMQNLTDKK
ncbi:MAG: MAG4270 family putative restriction endonuclease [Vagococcus fluvialis]